MAQEEEDEEIEEMEKTMRGSKLKKNNISLTTKM